MSRKNRQKLISIIHLKPSSCKEHFFVSNFNVLLRHDSRFQLQLLTICFKLSLQKGHPLLFLLTERRGKRKESPLHPAPNAVIIDTTDLTPSEVVVKILKATEAA